MSETYTFDRLYRFTKPRALTVNCFLSFIKYSHPQFLNIAII